jgi:Zn-dependent protease
MNLIGLAVFIPALMVAMTIHEAAHALMGHWLGDPTAKNHGRLSLNPFVHIDPIFTVLIPAIMIAMNIPPILAAKPVPFNPYAVRFGEFGAALVALAGPLSNMLLALITAIVLRAMDDGSTVYAIVRSFMILNISLSIFNLIPWPPLDGSRVLYAFAPSPVKKLMDSIEAMGIVGLFIFIFVAFSAISPLIHYVENGLLRWLT